MIFDTHTHYDDEAYDGDRDAVLGSLPDNGVGLVCNIGASLKGTVDSIALAERYPFVYAAAGVHPDEVNELDEEAFARLCALAQSDKVVAIGEIGLDYHGFGIYEGKPGRETQKYWFERQLKLAAELDLPVVVHSRNAAADTLELVTKAHEELGSRGIIHCFSYTKETAMKYVRMGFYIGIGGVLTYEGQKKLTKAIEAVPVDRIVLETDCPYLAPVPERPGRNYSGYLSFVRDRLAEVKGLSSEEVERVTFENGCRVYGIAH